MRLRRDLGRAALAIAASLAIAPRVARAESATLPYVRFQGTALVGSGLRFNNPYRLATPLGSDAESVSRTATYLDFGLGALVGAPTGFQHGPALRLSFAVEGIHQQVLAPSYAACRAFHAFQPCLRVGVPIILNPSTNVGAELGVSVAYFVRAGIGVTAELVGDLFYGAATREASYPAYPIVSAQAGIVVALEALP